MFGKTGGGGGRNTYFGGDANPDIINAPSKLTPYLLIPFVATLSPSGEFLRTLLYMGSGEFSFPEKIPRLFYRLELFCVSCEYSRFWFYERF